MSGKPRIVGDLSDLPGYAFDHRSLTWWGTIAFMLIEGTGFLLAGGAYLYLMGQEPHWPPAPHPPALIWGTVLTLLLLLSVIPNMWVDRMAHAEKLKQARLGAVLMSFIGLLALGVRVLEFPHLNVRWDQNAYGSIQWALIALHTTHILTDVYDTCLLAVVMYRHKVDGRRFSDVSDNALYWNFVVLTWLPLYVLIYWVPRWAP